MVPETGDHHEGRGLRGEMQDDVFVLLIGLQCPVLDVVAGDVLIEA